jgi:DNA polymerase-1
VPPDSATETAAKNSKTDNAAPAKHLYLVDGSGYIFRAYFGIQRGMKPMTRSDGTPTGAVYQFTRMVLKLVDEALADKAADYLAVVFDKAEKTFRNEIYPEYKAHRDDPPDDLVPQFPMVREATRAMGLPSIELSNYEADDIIASYACQASAQGIAVTIVSSDKDLMQLVGASADGVKIGMYDPMKEKPIGPAEVMEKFGVTPDKVIEVQAIAGDSVDNVPGVRGIGVDTAAELIAEFGTVEAVLDVAADKEKCELLVREKIAALEKDIYAIAGKTFSIGATKQLAEVLFVTLKLTAKPGKSGGFSTDTATMQELKQKGHAIAGKILRWRALTKLCGAAGEALRANAENARVSKKLVTLKTDIPLPMAIEAMPLRRPDPERLVPFLVANEFKSILTQRGFAPSAGGAPASDAAQAARPQTPGSMPPPATAPAPMAPPPMAAIDRTRYALVQDEAALEAWIARAWTSGIVALDAELTGPDSMRAELVGFSLALGAGEACYVPVAHRKGGAQGMLALEQPKPGDALARAIRQVSAPRALELMKPLLESDAVLKVGHNIKNALQHLARNGIALAPTDDTILMSFVLDAGRHGHGLDELAERYLKHTTIGYDAVCGTGKARIPFAEVPVERARDYAAECAEVAFRLHALFKARFVAEKLSTVYETIERPLPPILATMEREGVTIDPAALAAMSEDFAARMAELEAEAYKQAGAPFNIGSPKQLGEVLFEKLQLPGGRKGKTGAYGTDSSVLETLVEAHPLPKTVLDWRQLSKLKSTYADALLTQINPTTKRVHTNYSLTGAQTGRLSSTDPNLQNIPIRTEEGRKIRRAFVAAKGMKLISLDYSQIELRLLAHVANMDVLKQAFRDGVDIHALTASQVFGVPIETMEPSTRRRAKAINFGIIYGISAFGLANQLGIERGEAAAYIEAYFQRYPGIRDYMEQTKAFAKRNGFVVTPFGRRIHITGFTSGQPGMRGFAERQSINAPLQGGAADVIKRAMIRIPEALAKKKLGAKMLLQVHDELLFEAPEAEVEATIAALRPVMEKAALPALELSVPLVVDAGAGDNWAEAH